MNNFQEHGFLSNNLSEFEDIFRKKYEPWLNFLFEINNYAQVLQYKLDISNENGQQLVCASLYARCISMYQAAIFISIKGMETQAIILLRCLLESLFNLVASSKSEEVVKKFVAADQFERRKFFNKARMWKSDSLRDLAEKHATDEIIQQIQNDIDKTEAQRFPTEQVAIKAELHDWYLTAYSIFSHSVHSSVRDLEKHLIINDQGDITGLINEPTIDEYDRLFATAAEAMLHALKAVEKVFDLKTSEFVNEKYKVLAKLAKKIKR